MERIFLEVWNNAFAASWLILAVIVLRMLLKKAPRWMVCLLWGFVAIRLVFPFHIESVLSLIPNTVPAGTAHSYSAAPSIDAGIQGADSIINPVIEKQLKPDPVESVNPFQIWTAVCSLIWIIGAAGMLIYTFISFLLLKKKVSASIRIFDNLYVCDDLKSPFILGIIRPRIYLPSRMDAVTAECVLAHERTHLKRWDHVWKPFGFLILAVYWFHPLCWAAYILLCRDIEYACDEKATKDMDKIRRADYCQALLICSTKKRKIAACPVAFGEAGVKGRIWSILHYKKPAFWMVAASLAACAFVAACFMTDPKAEGQAQVSKTGAGQEKQTQEAQAEDFSAQDEKSIGMLEDGHEEKNKEDKNSVDMSRQKVTSIVEHAASMSREGYQEVSISYIDNVEVGWDDSSENPWETEEQRDLLAQAALQELYTLTGYQLKECVYTTDGSSRFIFGKSADAIKKSTAFYTRDYGWMLAGNSTPYMGFVNARRVWYSDVQQTDSPYHDPQYQGHGAIPVWFLDHSGVYQGEKIKGYDVFDLEDPVFTHVKLYFDGGYYIVVSDEEIESSSEISGPYYEADKKREAVSFDGNPAANDGMENGSVSRTAAQEPDSSFEQPEQYTFLWAGR